MEQRTIKDSVHFQGKGIHTGQDVKLDIYPSAPDSGIVFCRVDLDRNLKVKALIEYVCLDELRQTSLVVGQGIIRTIEHLMATFHGLGVDNALVEVDGEELPAMDGSALEFTAVIQKAGLIRQAAKRHWIVIDKPVFVIHGDQSLVVLSGLEFSEFQLPYVIHLREQLADEILLS